MHHTITNKNNNNKNELDQNLDDSADSEDTFGTVDDLSNTQKLIACYQMQVDENGNCLPVYLGSYPDVPLPVNKSMKYKNYNLHVVTYVLTDEEIKNKLFKIVGINIFKQNKRNSLCSLDLIKNDEEGLYQLLFNDHHKNSTSVVENLEKFPGKDHVLEYIIKKAFEEPVKSILIK